MSEHAVTSLTTDLAVDAVAWGRAPRQGGRTINRRVRCADGFLVSVQASEMHYANDSTGGSPYWRDVEREGEQVVYPFTTFEIGNPSDDVIEALDEYDSGGVWAWVPRSLVVDLLDAHGGAVAWEGVVTPAPAHESPDQ